MFNIQKISQRYNQRQDRIEVAIENEEGKVIRLWLTQRLANRIIANLAKWLLELQDQKKIEDTTMDSETHKKNKTVDFSAFEEEGLLRKVDIIQNQKKYLLTFNWGLTGVASFKIGAKQLNQYIEGLRQLYQAAQWESKVFTESKMNTLPTQSKDVEDFSEDVDLYTRTIH